MGKKSKKSDETEVSKINEEVKTSNEQSNNMNVLGIIDFYRGYTLTNDKNIPFPVSIANEPRIFIEEDVYKSIKNHSLENTTVEICGVLIGEVRFDNLGNYLYVCGSIRGEKSKNSGVNVSFTPETWDYIHEVKDSKYPNYLIIGWYHSHPGFGIFLSDMDKFIQDNFFNMPYQVALVVDPKISKSGIFTWQEGKIRPLQHCWVGKDKINLEIGSVGGEETFIEAKIDENDNEYNDSSISDRKNNTNNINSDSNSNFYKQAFCYLLCFTLAFVLANIFNIITVTRCSSYAAQAETREIITAWAKDFSIASDLSNLTQFIDVKIKELELKQATSTIDIKEIKDVYLTINIFLKQVLNNSRLSNNKAIEVIKNLAERNINIQNNSEQKHPWIFQNN